MPDKGSVVPYAAGASLAAVALIYVFGPTFTIDHDTSSSKKKSIVGLRNQANDCFINSVLQALAGLGELRVYLIQETHRRRIEDQSVYANLIQPAGPPIAQWKLQGLQDGLVTHGLKDMLDALNERPIYIKSVSPFPFVRVLEVAFKQRISRQQQDAQEFLQIVAERLKDEYHAGQRARIHARKQSTDANLNGTPAVSEKPSPVLNGQEDGDGDDDEKQPDAAPAHSTPDVAATPVDGVLPLGLDDLGDEGFPMEGKYESHIECQTCRYRTKPREETFCTLTLAVPQVTSTSLNSCFDGIFKTEYIDDFKCEMCRLVQTKANLEHELSRSTSDSFKAQAADSIEKLRAAMETDPERPPEDVELGDIRYAPKRRIAKTTRLTLFPKVLAVHLSRSIYGGQMTQKNSAKVAFPENLPLGGLGEQRRYKLLGVVTHRGGHNSGHYEAFRRQNLPSPYHNSNTFQPSGIYSKTPTPISTPEILPRRGDNSPAVSTPDLLSPAALSTPSLESPPTLPAPPRSVPADAASVRASLSSSQGRERDAETSSLRSVAASTKSAISRLTSPRSLNDGTMSPRSLQFPAAPPLITGSKKPRRKKALADKWWRVSDEKVKEAKTSDVLGMQREVYLLFYELEK